MTPALPAYYSSLAPFRELFQTGLPILTYHKLGPRPRGVRMKGLYLGEPLFASQLRELKQAGFSSASLNQVRTEPGVLVPKNGARIILTFDDGYENVLVHGLKVLEERGFKLFDHFRDPIGDRMLPPKRCGHKGLIKEEVISAFRLRS